MKEVHLNWIYYKTFSQKDQDILRDTNEYIRNQIFNNNTGDLILTMLCNAFVVSAVVYRVDGNRLITINIPPISSPSTGTVRLLLQGQGAGAHYDAVLRKSVVTYRVSSQSGAKRSTSSSMSPENVMPLPKAPSRNPRKGRKKLSSAVLTDTPVKAKIEKQQNQKKKIKPMELKKNQRKKERPKKLQKSPITSQAKDNEEHFCIICNEPYSNSKPGEIWVQCNMCKGWSHEECALVEHNGSYSCEKCND